MPSKTQRVDRRDDRRFAAGGPQITPAASTFVAEWFWKRVS